MVETDRGQGSLAQDVRNSTRELLQRSLRRHLKHLMHEEQLHLFRRADS